MSLQRDRQAGVLVGMAAGDALGAGYEFTTPQGTIELIADPARGFELGEWTDDTDMAVAIAEVTAKGQLDRHAIGERFLAWYRQGPKDYGIQIGSVLGKARTGADLPAAAEAYYAQHPNRSAGNGSLMRIGPVALHRLGDDAGMAEAARAVSALTHADPQAGDACALWCIAIDRAVREGRLDGVWDGLEQLPAQQRDAWAQRLREAEERPPSAFSANNGYVVVALQAAHAAINATPIPTDRPHAHLAEALRAAVAIGTDTDTVAAIAGMVLGGRWGASAVPFGWQRRLHGWPDGSTRYGTADLMRLAVLTARGGEPDGVGWPLAEHLILEADGPGGERVQPAITPVDEALLAGSEAALPVALEEHGVDAVVSLSRVGRKDVPTDGPKDREHHQVLLADQTRDENPNLASGLEQAVDAVAELRLEGKKVFVHCAAGQSRTPTVVSGYLVAELGYSPQAAREIVAAMLPVSTWNGDFQAWVDEQQPGQRRR